MEEVIPLYFDITTSGRKKPKYGFGPVPVFTECPFCKRMIQSIVKPRKSSKFYVVAAYIFTFGCCGLRYLKERCKDRIHYCPKCNAELGPLTL